MRPFQAAILIGFGCLVASDGWGQTSLEIDSPGFVGRLHDNRSNEKRQGNGVSPLALRTAPSASLFRTDAVGLNFEHVFNGAAAQKDKAMFTPRQDLCDVKDLGGHRFELTWPAKESQWKMDSKMQFDLSKADQIDLKFRTTPRSQEEFSQGYVAMMWASYMGRTIDRKIRFWGEEDGREGWVEFGDELEGDQIEVGTVAHVGVPELSYEAGAETLNLIESPSKKFVTPFYFGMLDGDQDLKTTEDRYLYLVMFDQTESIRFAMWNFFRDEAGRPDTHSPAWDWQFVVRDPKVGTPYEYRMRIVVKPFEGQAQIWEAYETWREELGGKLPSRPKASEKSQLPTIK